MDLRLSLDIGHSPRCPCGASLDAYPTRSLPVSMPIYAHLCRIFASRSLRDHVIERTSLSNEHLRRLHRCRHPPSCLRCANASPSLLPCPPATRPASLRAALLLTSSVRPPPRSQASSAFAPLFTYSLLTVVALWFATCAGAAPRTTTRRDPPVWLPASSRGLYEWGRNVQHHSRSLPP